MVARRLEAILGVIVLTVAALPAPAQGQVTAAFTYQGLLKEDGDPASGSYDFVFRLYDAPTGGTQIGFDVPVDDWPVADGLFTVQLNFGYGGFNGDDRWLEVRVRPGDSGGSYAVLSPRQELAATPYALYALYAPTAGGLVLPFAGSAAAPSPAFSVTNAGGGQAGEFLKPAAGGTESALKAASTGVNNAVWAINTGGADIGTIPSIPEDAGLSAWNLGSGPAVRALNGGLGQAINALVENTTSTADVITASTTSDVWGSALVATIPSATNSAPAVWASTNGPAPAVYGFTNGSFPAGLFENLGAFPGSPISDGVYGVTVNTYPDRRPAGVHAAGFGASAPGMPNAAALNVDNGAMGVSGPVVAQRTAMTIPVPGPWISISSCKNVPAPPAHIHTIGYYCDVAVANDLILGGEFIFPPPGIENTTRSILIPSVETNAPPVGWASYYIQVHSQMPGSCVLRVTRMGDPDGSCTPPDLIGDAVYAHLLIINPNP